MDNYFNECPPMMDDGRLFTDYRSSQVREELFKQRNRVSSENEARTFRINNGNNIIDAEWMHFRNTRSCFPNKYCFHKYPTTRTTTAYNNAEILAYNKVLPAPKCDVIYNDTNNDYRMSVTRSGRNRSRNNDLSTFTGYPESRCPKRNVGVSRLLPERLEDLY